MNELRFTILFWSQTIHRYTPMRKREIRMTDNHILAKGKVLTHRLHSVFGDKTTIWENRGKLKSAT